MTVQVLILYILQAEDDTLVLTDEKVRRRFQEEAQEGKIACADCFRIAGEFGIPTEEIASTLTDLHIKIIKCQLGCFP
jgi:LAO/AO transport system kinase